MKIIYTFFVILLNHLIDHCRTTGVEPSTSKTLKKLKRIPSDGNLRQFLQVENVQLTEYKDGEMIELQQQDFFHLRKKALRENNLFRDPQFPKELFFYSGEKSLRPKDIVKKPQEPVLFIDNKKPFHVKQGRLGDCWFVVGLLHLQYHPNLFQFVVQPYDQTFNVNAYAGIFHFRFWQAGIWVDVVIDDRLPTVENKLIYTSSGYPNEFWPALIEKAYAKLLYRSYEKLTSGLSRRSMQDLSGGITETYDVKSTADSLFEIIQNAKDRSTMISCATVNVEELPKKSGTNVLNLIPLHSYAITAVKTVTGDKADGEFKLIRIRDPYGVEYVDLYHGNIKSLFTEATLESKLDIEIIGESWILYDNFVEYFLYVEICNLTPNQMTNHVYSNTGKKLLLSGIEGKFIGASTQKLIESNNFYKINPQYRMVLVKPDEGKKKCSVLIGVSLKRRHDLQKDFSSIYFRLISYANYDDNDGITRVPKPLSTASSMKCNEICLISSEGQVGKRIDLEPGIYYIIPYIDQTFKGATFFLQILSEQQDILEVYDRDIHMPPVTKRMGSLLSKNMHLLKTDHDLFSTMAVDFTINFKDLYNILKDDKLSLNKNCHIAQELDDTIVLELELLVTRKLVPQRKLSLLTIAKTLLITQEVFENYGEKKFPEYIKTVFIPTVLKRNGYFIGINIFNAIYTILKNPSGSIHFEHYILTIFAIKNKIASSCEEFNAKLCQDLVLMVHNGMTKFESFNEPGINELRINEQQFKLIIKFIKKSKEIFDIHATGPFYSVPFTKLKNLFDAFDYKLTHHIIATVFHRHGNDVDIFYHQFVQSIVDVTLIFGKIQENTSNEEGKNLKEDYHKMFDQLWKKKQEKRNSIENNERESGEPADDKNSLKKMKT